MLVQPTYDLPDCSLFSADSPAAGVVIWVPEKVFIVIGQSNQPEMALRVEEVLKEGIPVYRRPSGGEAVVLTPRMLVISLRRFHRSIRSPHVYFRPINQAIAAALEHNGLRGIEHRGISDLSFKNRKILGSAIYQNRAWFTYHGVLNVAEDTRIIARYLAHPLREPDYRHGRRHETFVTSLADIGFSPDLNRLTMAIESRLHDWKG